MKKCLTKVMMTSGVIERDEFDPESMKGKSAFSKFFSDIFRVEI